MILLERVISIGFKPEHERYREEYRNQIHDIIRNTYKGIGGYVGLGHGTQEESDAIHDAISSNNMKVVRRGNSVSAVKIYKDMHGRKSIAGGQNGSMQGKRDYAKLLHDDHKQQRAWAELGGAPNHIADKMGVPTIPSNQAEKILGKPVEIVSPTHYKREGIPGTKSIRGYPKLNESLLSFKEFLDRK